MTEFRAARSTGLIVVASLLLLALFYIAAPVFIPVALAIFVMMLVWPLQRGLQARMPQLPALLLTLLVTIGVIVAAAMPVIRSANRLIQWLILNAGRFQDIYLRATAWLEDHGLSVIGPLAEHFNVAWLIRLSQEVAGRLNSLLGLAILVFIMMMLGLLETDALIRRLKAKDAQPHGARILQAGSAIAPMLRRFMLVRTLASVLTGVVVWAFARLMGLEFAFEWGAIAFAFNYIPFIGPFIATLFPTLFAMAQFESWEMAALLFAGFNLIQFLIGSYLEPRLLGATLSVSPFAVIFAVLFWGFMWGVPGAFIGVPILIAFVVACRQHHSSRWIAILLSAGTEKETREADGVA